MNTLSIISTKTMSYDADASIRSFAIVEKLVSFAGAVLRAARKMGPLSTVPALRADHA